MHNRRSFRAVWPVLGYRWTPLLVLCMIVTWLGCFGDRAFPVHLLFAVLVGSCVIQEDHVLAPILNWPAAVYMGTISYSMYLTHGLMYDGLERLQIRTHSPWPAHGVGASCWALAGAATVASLTLRVYEAPFLRRKKRFGA